MMHSLRVPILLALLLSLFATADEDSNPCLHPRTRTELSECTVAPSSAPQSRTCAQLPASETALQALSGSLCPSYTGRCRMREVCEDCGKVMRNFDHGVQVRAAGLPSASLDGRLSASRILPGAYTFSYKITCHAEQPASVSVVFAAHTETDRLDADRSLDCLMDFRLDTDAAHTMVRTMTPHVPLGYALRIAPEWFVPEAPSATFNDLAEILASYIPALSAPMGNQGGADLDSSKRRIWQLVIKITLLLKSGRTARGESMRFSTPTNSSKNSVCSSTHEECIIHATFPCLSFPFVCFLPLPSSQRD